MIIAIYEHHPHFKQFVVNQELDSWRAFCLSGVGRIHDGWWFLFDDCDHEWVNAWSGSNFDVADCHLCGRHHYSHMNESRGGVFGYGGVQLNWWESAK